MNVFVESKLKVLRTKLDKFPVLQKVEEVTRVPKESLVIAGALLSVLVIMMTGVGLASLTSIVGFVYPAFKTFQALESKTQVGSGGDKKDDTRIEELYFYWMIYASFFMIEIIFLYPLCYWIPLCLYKYYLYKLAFLVWLMHPYTNGAQVLYVRFLKNNTTAGLKEASKKKNDAAAGLNNVAMKKNEDAKHVVGATKLVDVDERRRILAEEEQNNATNIVVALSSDESNSTEDGSEGVCE